MILTESTRKCADLGCTLFVPGTVEEQQNITREIFGGSGVINQRAYIGITWQGGQIIPVYDKHISKQLKDLLLNSVGRCFQVDGNSVSTTLCREKKVSMCMNDISYAASTTSHSNHASTSNGRSTSSTETQGVSTIRSTITISQKSSDTTVVSSSVAVTLLGATPITTSLQLASTLTNMGETDITPRVPSIEDTESTTGLTSMGKTESTTGTGYTPRLTSDGGTDITTPVTSIASTGKTVIFNEI